MYILSAKSKPDLLKLHLQNFMEVVEAIITNGTNFTSEIYSLSIVGFICGTPVKAYLKYVNIICILSTFLRLPTFEKHEQRF